MSRDLAVQPGTARPDRTRSMLTAEAYDIFVLKLNSSGAYQWHTFYGSSVIDYGYGIAIDGSGNVYVTGYSTATWNGPAGQNPLHAYSGSYDIFVLKLDSSGAYQWHTFYGSSGLDEGHGIAIDGSGNVYVTGISNATWNGPAGENPLHDYSVGVNIVVVKLNRETLSTPNTPTGPTIAITGLSYSYTTGGLYFELWRFSRVSLRLGRWD